MPENIRLNCTHCFIIKIPNKRELQQIAFNHSSDIAFKDFINLYKKCIFLVIDPTRVSHNLLRFRKDLVERM